MEMKNLLALFFAITLLSIAGCSDEIVTGSEESSSEDNKVEESKEDKNKGKK